MRNRSSKPVLCPVITLQLSCNYIDSSFFYDILQEVKDALPKSINRFQTSQFFSNLLYSIIKLETFFKTIDFWLLP